MIALSVPGSKSITNRALLIAALAKGKSTLTNILESDDTRAMKRALTALGAHDGKFHWSQSKKPRRPIYCANAGTAMRFLTAVLAAHPFESILDGDARMRQRPIEDLLDGLRQLGAHAVSLKDNGCPPVRVRGPLVGGNCSVPATTSSQFISGLLIAAPLAQKNVTITIRGDLVSKPYVDMTIEIMKKFGAHVRRSGYKKFFIKAGQQYKARTFAIEGDASSASYFWGISLLTGEPITIKNIPQNSLQADAQFLKYARLVLQAKKNLKINCADFPDSAMTLAVLSAFRKGKNHLTGLANLRVKECDRLHALACELKKIGCSVQELKDSLIIHGDPHKLHGAHIKTYNDHRMAMCFSMAGFVVPGIRVQNPECVKKTYPHFWKDLAALKKQFQQKNIILTGMRGTGKSRLGKALAAQLKRPFIDIDRMIEKSAHMSISEIVAQYGWKHFRALEKKAVQKLTHTRCAVISSGGGTLMDPTNEKNLKKNGKVIVLKSSLTSLEKRLSKSKNRPSLTGTHFLTELRKIYKHRKKRYDEVADAFLDVSKNTSQKNRDIKEKTKKLLYITARLGL